MELTLAEKFLILIWDKTFSTVPILARPGLGDALKIAMIEDLRLRKKISIESSKMIFMDDKSTGDAFLDDMYAKLKKFQSPFIPQNIIWKIFDQLIEKGAFTRKKFLLEFQYFLVDPAVRQIIVDDLKSFVARNDSDDKQAPLLISLLQLRNALILTIPLSMRGAALSKQASIITKLQVLSSLDFTKKIAVRTFQKQILDPTLAQSWKNALSAYDRGELDSYLINAFPVFEQAIKRMYKECFGDESQDTRKCIDALYRDGHLKHDLRAIQWVWTVRNKKLHEGINLTRSQIEGIKNTINVVVNAYFNLNV
ncbi:MAG TPA: GPP34 family phosphoprotein [Candidatus Lokiarchaeia archaeon]|nr:GPP34 family phosphoprotein [Candidatus Lokiarchaeia archaeon]